MVKIEMKGRLSSLWWGALNVYSKAWQQTLKKPVTLRCKINKVLSYNLKKTNTVKTCSQYGEHTKWVTDVFGKLQCGLTNVKWI